MAILLNENVVDFLKEFSIRRNKIELVLVSIYVYNACHVLKFKCFMYVTLFILTRTM